MEVIRSRISIGKRVLENIRALLTARRISLEMRKRFDKCFIWIVVFLYGGEMDHQKGRRKVPTEL